VSLKITRSSEKSLGVAPMADNHLFTVPKNLQENITS